ncbi:MAG: oxygen-independent coproporphyrinogen III oxidase [Reyranellaceae bacterium]
MTRTDDLQAVIAKYAARPTPRYTSYPTAPHFQPDFPPAQYRRWLRQTDPRQPISLYLHVPFCRRMCWYCGCNMKLAARYAPVADYVATLVAEIDLVAQALGTRRSVGHLHWGGGTPTSLTPDDFARVMERLRGRFDIAAGAEIAVETDPRTLSGEMMARLGAEGVTRASFGVQEFDAQVQQAINRIQPPEMVARAVAGLRGAGIAGINFDLIYGLPHQSVATLARTIELCAAMRPDRVALFGYAHVPWMAKNQRLIEESALPDASARAAQALAAEQALQAGGYQSIGIDHYALPGDALAVAARNGALRRNFQGYTTDTAETLIGLGVTAIGRTRAGYVQNIAETGAWARAVQAGLLPVAKGRAICGEDRLRGHVIERIMCDGAIDCAAAGERFGAPAGWCEEALLELAPLERDGVLSRQDGTIRIDPRARPLARVVAAAFDAHLGAGKGRHAATV